MGQYSAQFYTGFLMDNNCNFIAESGTTEDWNAVSNYAGRHTDVHEPLTLPLQMCDDHHYSNGADVWCNNRVYVFSFDGFL